MFFNNFINNIIKSMMAVCVVANGWSSGEALTENLPGGGADVAQKRVNDLNEDSISKRSKDGSPISVNTPPPYNNGNDSSQTLTPGPQPSEENSNTTQLLKSITSQDGEGVNYRAKNDIIEYTREGNVAEGQTSRETICSLVSSVQSVPTGEIQELGGNDEDHYIIPGANIQAVNGKNKNIDNEALGKESVQSEDKKELRKYVYSDGYIKISLPEEFTNAYRMEFASDCYIDSLDTPEDQIIYALNNSHASNFCQLIKLNWGIISNMELEVFAELSRCLYHELNIWFKDQDNAFVQLKQKILHYAEELRGDGKSHCKEVSDKLRGGNDISKLKDALKLLNDYIY